MTGAQPSRAWWSGCVRDLLDAPPGAIVERLAYRLVETHPLNRATQLDAWRAQVTILGRVFADRPDTGDWQVLLEYPLLRLGRRIDAVLLTGRLIIVLEFKVGAAAITREHRAQAEDYALDLYDFHAGSRSYPIVPIVLATRIAAPAIGLPLLLHGVTPVLDASPNTLGALLTALAAHRSIAGATFDVLDWDAAPYRPVPTIVEAATMLYRRHGVAEIAAARADLDNLGRTTRAISEAVADARAKRSHIVVFVTGIPGAGKTLCGLNIVFGADTGAAFLTGNPPLVHVMREALARDAAAAGRNPRLARQEAESAIQPLTGFLRDNLARSDPPHERVIVFDEAQRAWDAAYGRRKFERDASEAALFLDIMRRHDGWAVLVALVGQGQEINTGEAGLAEWGRALAERAAWEVRAAADVLDDPEPRQRLHLAAGRVQIVPALRLAVSVRAIRNSAAAPWVDAVLRDATSEAAEIAVTGIPFMLTRDLAELRATLRRLARGNRRAGLVCSTGARRLRADGITPDFPHLDETAVSDWFLRRWPDVRASDALEQPATQFACQGLELDIVGLCWGGDLIRAGLTWQARRFLGTNWSLAQNADRIAWCRNTYRVLLTRARYETIIWVPRGDFADATRKPSDFDAVADFLVACGVRNVRDIVQ